MKHAYNLHVLQLFALQDSLKKFYQAEHIPVHFGRYLLAEFDAIFELDLKVIQVPGCFEVFADILLDKLERIVGRRTIPLLKGCQKKHKRGRVNQRNKEKMIQER